MSTRSSSKSTRQARARRQAAPRDPARARRHRGAARRMGEARQSGAHPGAGAAPSHAEADRRRGSSTGSTTCRSGRPSWCRRRTRSDRRGDRQSRTGRPHADRQHLPPKASRSGNAGSPAARGRRDERDADAAHEPRARRAARREGAVAPADHAHAALRPERRPRRQGARAHRPRHPDVRASATR